MIHAAFQAVDEVAGGSGWFGWQAIHVPLLLALPVLLILSGFFSSSETAMFSLTELERINLRRKGGLVDRAVHALLMNPRMLLITILLGNMTVNVLYFVTSSVLLMEADTSIIGGLLFAAGSLILILLVGEVGPKLLASTHRSGFVTLIAPPLLAFHQVVGPIRIILSRLVIEPLNRLTVPHDAPPLLSEEELSSLLQISGEHGVIDVEEQRILQDVLKLQRLKVREVMTPRVQMAAVEITAKREDVLTLVKDTPRKKIPVYEGDLDHIVGMLHVKQYLLHDPEQPITQHLVPAHYVPEMATLEPLLDHFRSTHSAWALVVDEFGGTAGVVAMEDVVEEVVGDIISPGEEPQEMPQLIGLGKWRASGNVNVRDWADAFGHRLVSPRTTTLGGLIIEKLGRMPKTGDNVTLGNVNLEVETVKDHQAETVIITLGDTGGREPDQSPVEKDSA